MRCPQCDIFLSSLKAYEKHHGISHGGSCFVCPRCSGRQYPTFRTLSNHFKKCAPNLSDVVCSTPSNQTSLSPSTSSDHLSNVCEASSGSFSDFECTSSLESNTLRAEVDLFVSQLYCKKKMPRQYVQDIIEKTGTLIRNGILSNLKSVLAPILNDDQLVSVTNIFKEFENPFCHVSTEYLRFQYFKESGEYIPPVQYEIGEVEVSVRTPNGPNLKTKKIYGQYIQLDLVLKKYLELPEAFNDIMSYVNALKQESDVVENFVQCKLWKEKTAKFKEDDVVLPIHVFYDDVQCNNPLGSHSQKLAGVYVSIPCLPPECQSSIDNIFLALVFPSVCRPDADKHAFGPLIKILTSLEKDGIVLDLCDGPKRVYFVTGLLLGDNQGVNSVGGFVESPTSNYYCRFCKVHRSEMVQQCFEDKSLLRTEQSYNADLLLNDYSKTGVKSDSVFNELPSFHITSNYCVDNFHNYSEGICHYVMLHVLKHCIPKYFSLEVLNNIIELFSYGACDSNKFPSVSPDFATRDKLKMSGSETLLFVRMFGLLVGDRVPQEDPLWILYLKLRELLDKCMSKSLSTRTSVSLKVLVQEFNEMYLSTTNDTLKPKFHLQVHYPMIIDESGPVALTSSKRFESKHRSLLMPAHATESRKQICRTVSIQHQLQMCFRFKAKCSIIPETEYGPMHEVSWVNFPDPLPECMLSILPTPMASCLSPNWIQFKGTKYKTGMVLLVKTDDSGSPIFGLIEKILEHNKSFVLVFSFLLNLGFDTHVHSYEVECTDSWSKISITNLFDPLPHSIHFSTNGKKFVVLRTEL